MATLPGSVEIREEGPREGFQFERGVIPTERKIALIDALSTTGITHIQTMSFVNPKAVPGMADAEAVIAGLTMRPGVKYTGLWMNERGLERALATKRLALEGKIGLPASDAFLARNTNRTREQHIAEQHELIERYRQLGLPVEQGSITAAFGCNFEGDVPLARVVALAGELVEIAAEHGITLHGIALLDTMAWATPLAIKRVVGAVQDAHPGLDVSLHLHDTRGMGIANAFAGLEMGVRRFDASVAGLGGCPFAGHRGAAGNVCTEDLVFLCDEMGIETGIDLDALLDCARLAEEIVGHPLPGSVKTGGSLAALRKRQAVASA
jgi:hydroxymethylglutaryl-CoA lyase